MCSLRSQSTLPRRTPRRPHKFRFLITAKWLAGHFSPCRAADIGGGKGLLAYLLNQEGWDVSVIDPVQQNLPHKYRADTGKRVFVPEDANIRFIARPFVEELAKGFDLLIGLHAHGVNFRIIDAAKKFRKDFFLIPCCVIDEPVVKRYGVNFRKSLFEYATGLGLPVKEAKLRFMGKDIAIYTDQLSSPAPAGPRRNRE